MRRAPMLWAMLIGWVLCLSLSTYAEVPRAESWTLWVCAGPTKCVEWHQFDNALQKPGGWSRLTLGSAIPKELHGEGWGEAEVQVNPPQVTLHWNGPEEESILLRRHLNEILNEKRWDNDFPSGLRFHYLWKDRNRSYEFHIVSTQPAPSHPERVGVTIQSYQVVFPWQQPPLERFSVQGVHLGESPESYYRRHHTGLDATFDNAATTITELTGCTLEDGGKPLLTATMDKSRIANVLRRAGWKKDPTKAFERYEYQGVWLLIWANQGEARKFNLTGFVPRPDYQPQFTPGGGALDIGGVRPGMLADEVRGCLGAPDRTTDTSWFYLNPPFKTRTGPRYTRLQIRFSAQGKVTYVRGPGVTQDGKPLLGQPRLRGAEFEQQVGSIFNFTDLYSHQVRSTRAIEIFSPRLTILLDPSGNKANYILRSTPWVDW